MKAARLHAYETAPVVEEIATPDIGPDEVLVRVAASALNPLDVKLQQGAMHWFFPLEFPVHDRDRPCRNDRPGRLRGSRLE